MNGLKKGAAHIYIYIYKRILVKKKKRRNKIGSFVVMWMKLESYTA